MISLAIEIAVWFTLGLAFGLGFWISQVVGGRFEAKQLSSQFEGLMKLAEG